MIQIAQAPVCHCHLMTYALIIGISITTLLVSSSELAWSQANNTRPFYHYNNNQAPSSLRPLETRSQVAGGRRRLSHFIEQHPQSSDLLASAPNGPSVVVAPAATAAAAVQPYKCAKFCTCSSVSVLETSGTGDKLSVIESPIDSNQPAAAPIAAGSLPSAYKPPADLETRLVNLTRVKCDSSQFSDVLTIDRRTQIIHISLPQDKKINGGGGELMPSGDLQERFKNSSIDYATQRQPKWPLPPLIMRGGSPPTAIKDGDASMPQIEANEMSPSGFRMPRLAQFSLLREIVIINLKFEVCDSEVFKRGQKLRRLKWNDNELRQVSRDCFRHLDKLIELNLDYNQLTELESALFSNLVHLKHLSLAHNRLAELAAHQFANLTRLSTLNLVGNAFKSINLFLFEPMRNSLQLLVLARNQIKNFVYMTMQTPVVVNRLSNNSLASSSGNRNLNQQQQQQLKQQQQLGGALFKNLIKLNVDSNRFERIKMLQLHRFYNVKFLSIRANQIQSIRDRAFDGLKLIELNLAQNKLQLISRCAFCNSTIKRLILAENNISLPLMTAGVSSPPASQNLLPPSPSAQQLVANLPEKQQELQNNNPLASNTQPLYLSATGATSSASMLVLSQSILGPLFNQLEYLDLSHNLNLAPQLELLLEPLLELQFLNLASIGLDRALPTPTLFKNLRQLKYLNLSQNSLDQLIAETVEPLGELEMLDLSSNAFNELDESLLVTLDELGRLKYLNLASNPWYCSQCKISPLYDWILRSPIYNATCLAPLQAQLDGSGGNNLLVSEDQKLAPGQQADQNQSSNPSKTLDDELESTAAIAVAAAAAAAAASIDQQAPNLAFVYRQTTTTTTSARGPQDYSLLAGSGDSQPTPDVGANVDFDLILNLFDGSGQMAASSNGLYGLGANRQAADGGELPNYLLDPSQAGGRNAMEQLARKRHLSERLRKSLATSEDDESIERTIASLRAASQLLSGFSSDLQDPLGGSKTALLDDDSTDLNTDYQTESLQNNAMRKLQLITHNQRRDLCLKCEFPSELRAFNLHELAPTDFKYCAGSAPRFAASEPKIGLTLAIVIIGALFCVIVIVIIMYRKKSNAYYPSDELTSQLENGLTSSNGGKGNQPVLSISSDLDNPYGSGGGGGGGGDATDYSSPPMSQSYESYSQEDEEGELDDEDEEEYDDEDEEEEEEEDDEEEDEELDEEFDEDEGEEDDDHQGQRGGSSGAGGSGGPSSSHQGGPVVSTSGIKQHKEEHHVTISEANQTDNLQEEANKQSKHQTNNTRTPASNQQQQQHISIVPINSNSNSSSTSPQHTNSSSNQNIKRASQRQPAGQSPPVEMGGNQELQRSKQEQHGDHFAPTQKPAQLSAADLQQQAQELKNQQKLDFEAAETRARNDSPMMQQAAPTRSARSHDEPPPASGQGGLHRPSNLRQSKTTLGGDLENSTGPLPQPPSPGAAFPPLPADFRSPSSPSGQIVPEPPATTTPSATPSPVPPPPLASQQPARRPKFQQHRQSSEHSTAGSVTFAATTSSRRPRQGHVSGHHYNQTSPAAAVAANEFQRRERLMSQTICVEPSELAGREASPKRSAELLLHQPNSMAQQVAPTSLNNLKKSTTVGRPSSRNGRAPMRGDDGQSSSSSQTQVELMSNRVRAKRPSIMATTAIQRRRIKGEEVKTKAPGNIRNSPQSSSSPPPAELNAEVLQQQQVHSILVPAKVRPPMKQLQQRNVISPQPPPFVRAQHRHHIKQLASKNFEDDDELASNGQFGNNGRSSEPTSSNGRQEQQTKLDEEEEEESLDLVANFADLPSDLEELENGLEQRVGSIRSDESHALNEPMSPVRSSAALELMDDEDREQIASMDRASDEGNQDEFVELNDHERYLKLNFGNDGQLRNSHSTHSALTQTGSRDFD